MKKIMILVLMFVGSTMLAHEGHDHDAPVTVQAPKAGQIKKLDGSYIEVVSKKNDLKIYFYDDEMKELTTERFQVTAQVKLPRKKTTEILSLTSSATHLEGLYDAKGAHRYTLTLNVSNSQNGLKNKVNFNIEPKK